jgi:hypothetical protein
VTQQVHLRAASYVAAVRAVHRSVRLWHRMDATFAAMRYPTGGHMGELQEAHRLLDVALWRARDALLGRSGRQRRAEE